MIDQTNEAAMRARAYQLLEEQRRDHREGRQDARSRRDDAHGDPRPAAGEGEGDERTPSNQDDISPRPAWDGPVEVRPRPVTPE